MIKKTLIWGGAVLVTGISLVIVVGILKYSSSNNSFQNQKTSTDYKNAEYNIEGKKIKLINGTSEITEAPDSASLLVTKYFGNEVRADLNNDGREDVVFLLTQNNGGSGTFYYVVAALNTLSGYVGSDAVLLGDRIAPQTTEMSRDPSRVNVVVVNYADRNKDEPMIAQPSVGKSIWLKLNSETMQFGEVVQNFEGESSPSVMTLPMKTWTWISTTYSDGKNVVPTKFKAFTVTFSKDGRFSATTDCNGVGGTFVTDKNKITFGQMMSTLMFCEDSQEIVFTKLLSETQNYKFTSKGELVLELKNDSGSSVFK